MRYFSTRGGAPSITFGEAVLAGLAPDGGLYVPESYPQFGPAELASLRGKDYRRVAFAVLRRFVGDMPGDKLQGIIFDAYNDTAFSPEIVPVQRLEDNLWLMNLSTGPTLAFKDVALRLLGCLTDYELGKVGGKLNILGATSGDTGSAAEHAMLGRKNVNVFMLSPKGRMSAFQRAQMYSIKDPRIHNLVIDGNFDVCQKIVKDLMADAKFKADYSIGAVNSINWARIAAQVVYHVWGYLQATKSAGQKIDIAVPSGNFGNAISAHVARSMGVPIRRIVIATNENDVLNEYFCTGLYRPRGSDEVHETTSPSMDIASASNFERLMFDAVGRDPQTLRDLWGTGSFNLKLDDLGFGAGFRSGSANQAEVIETIRFTFDKWGRVIDPHTAVAMKVGLDYLSADVPLVIAETASPMKFENTMSKAIGVRFFRPSRFEGLEKRRQHTVEFAADAALVRAFIEEYAI
ncbi:MAG: threonine synthase [Parcubacteria bacterium C7867-004]|nr:MAG: threonine synthase [Parcubacteria bacterium C7867-004]